MEKLIQQCQEFIAEARRMETEFVTLVRSCVYPQLLPPTVTEKVRGSIMELRNVHSQLGSEIDSGHPDQSKVKCQTLLAVHVHIAFVEKLYELLI